MLIALHAEGSLGQGEIDLPMLDQSSLPTWSGWGAELPSSPIPFFNDSNLRHKEIRETGEKLEALIFVFPLGNANTCTHPVSQAKLHIS